MKCEKCGGNISLEALHCPFCGEINIHAQQHVKDMARYQGEFARTRTNVYTVTRNYAGIAVRAGIITVLLILIIVFCYIGNESYIIKNNMRESNANRSFKKYSAIMDEYLAQEDYLAFGAFCEANCIETYNTKYEKYYQVMSVCYAYYQLYDRIMAANTAKAGDDFSERDRENYISSIVQTMEYYYRYLDEERYGSYEGADSEKERATIAQIKEDVHALLRAYCGLTEEDIAGFDSLSDAQRTIIIEERMGNAE